MLTDVLDQELEQGKLETVCHCFTLFKASFGIWLLDGGLSFSLFSFPCGFLVQAILGFPISWQLDSQGKSPRKKQPCRSPIIPQKSHSAPSLFPSSLRWPQDLLRFKGRNIDSVSWWRHGKVLQQQGRLQQATKCCRDHACQMQSVTLTYRENLHRCPYSLHFMSLFWVSFLCV